MKKKKKKKGYSKEEGGGVRVEIGKEEEEKRRKWAGDESNGPKRGEPDRFGSRKKTRPVRPLYKG